MARGMSKGSVFAIVITLLGMMNLSPSATDGLRGGCMACILPLQASTLYGHDRLVSVFGSLTRFISTGERKRKLEAKREIERLSLENARLRQEMDLLQDAVTQKGLQRLLPVHEEPVPARVVYRSFALWDTTLWVDVGEKDNKTAGEKNVAHNSPVLVGDSVVGVIDYVGKRWSRVRLLSDPLMMPSVRVVRGGVQNQSLVLHVDALNDALSTREDIGSWAALKELLGRVKKHLETTSETQFLAKGELQGSRLGAWRGGGHTLCGTGFNYDFGDEMGSSRDLRSGAPVTGGDATPLVKVSDLLVTTGLDGVFPPGLRVATVTGIDVLREGAYCYDLEAEPTAGNLGQVSVVFVLPPLERDQESY